MTKPKTRTGRGAANRTPGAKARPQAAPPKEPAGRETRTDTLIRLMSCEGGRTVQELATAVGWQQHSVRGFISGTLKKRSDLDVKVVKVEGISRYSIHRRGGAS